MSKRQFVVLVFRLFALYLVFILITNLGYLLNTSRFLGYGGGLSDLLIPLFAICIILFLISLLWRKSEWLMQKVFAIPVLSDEMANPAGAVTSEQPKEGTHEISENKQIYPEVPEMMDYYETPLSIESIELVAFSLLGLWAAITSIPTLVKEIYVAIENPIYIFSVGTVLRWSILPHLIQLVLGVWLFLRPWQFQGWIEKFKPKGEELD